MNSDHLNIAPNKGLISWFTHNPVTANLLMIIIIITGVVSFLTITRSLNPQIEPQNINISVVYPGAAPEEVERSVTIKIEERIKDIEGIRRFHSLSDESLSTINIEVAEDYDITEILDRVQSQVDSITSFPNEIERPQIARQLIRHQAIMIQVYGDMDEVSMKTLADEIKLDLLQNPLYGSIDILGARDYEISVEIPEDILRKHELTFDEVVRAINRFSIDIPGGRIKTSEGEILLRTSGQAYDQYDFESIVLKSFSDSTHITLGDIATIKDGFVEVDGFARFNGKPSLALAVFVGANQDMIAASRAARDYVAEKQKELPQGVSVVTWADVSFYLEGRLDMMTDNLLIGALLVFIVLMLFLDLKSAFWVMLGLPICFLGTFILMPLPFFDVTLNMISLFGFFVVLGIVVDDAIIIAESVHTQTYEYGDTLDNVVKGAKAVAMPATFGVLTTIAAFAPTLFVTGPLSAIPQAIGYVVIFCLIFSLIESKWILPAHLGMNAKKTSHSKIWAHISHYLEAARLAVEDRLNIFIEMQYRPLLKKAIDYRYVTLAIFIAAFIVTIGLLTSGIARMALIPEIPSDFLVAKVEMREGSNDRQMRNALTHIDRVVRDIEKQYLAETNDQYGLIKHSLITTDDGHTGIIMLELVKSELRNMESDELVTRWRDNVGDIAGSRLVSFSSVEDAGGPPLAFKLLGSDISQLAEVANKLEKQLRSYAGVYDIENGTSDINDELHITIKPSALSLGLGLADIGTQVRQAFYGAEAQRLQRGNDEVKVMVRLPKQERESLSTLENMYLTTPSGTIVPFSAVADLELKRSLAKHTRINGEKAVTVAARVDTEQTSTTRITKDILDNFAQQVSHQYPGVSIELDGNSLQEQEMFVKLAISFVLALAAIYVLLAIPLHSYSQPLIIMTAIPFGLIGAIVGHVIMDANINMLSFFGIIALAGVVVNDSLVMVSFINEAKTKGLRMEQAIVEAGVMRFRAILITSLTTFFGLLPMLFETSLQAQLVIPMAISLCFGIVFSTTITLILIPCFYQILNDINHSKSNHTPLYDSHPGDQQPVYE